MRTNAALCSVAILGAVACALPDDAAAQGAVAQSPIDSATATASPRNYQGRCPARIDFAAAVYVNRPVVVSYRWERSDHTISPIRQVEIVGAAAKIATSWEMGGPPGQTFKGWQQLHILGPIDFVSNAAGFSLACR